MLADKRPPLDPALMARRLHVDAIVLLGDLDRAWIESLRMLRIPRIGVHGNHDPADLLKEMEVEDLRLPSWVERQNSRWVRLVPGSTTGRRITRPSPAPILEGHPG